jgi:hypothetical protein
MSTTPIFDAVAEQYPGIHRASNLFPQPAPEPYVTFIKERGAWLQSEPFLKLVRWSWS